jgi:GrpB-like predicted nucleotidyltransferase (UPF0157 family)
MITIVPYDPRWPALFAAEAARIADALGDRAVRIEHVGSTAVPGLAAKPVIDIQIATGSLAELSPFTVALGGLAYRHVSLGAIDAVYPFLQRPAAWPATHHVHLCEAGSAHKRRHVAFRDYLRMHPEVAAEYAALKRSLAAMHRGDTLESRERYSLAKTGFVGAVLAQALAGGPGPTPATPGGAAAP